MAEQIFKKEVCWGEGKYNFIAEDEITVTITLDEYRNLVKESARHQEELRKVNEARYEAEKKANALREKLDKLLEATKEEDGDAI